MLDMSVEVYSSSTTALKMDQAVMANKLDAMTGFI